MAVEIETTRDVEAEPALVGRPSRRRKGLSAIAFVAIAILLTFGGVAALLLLPPSDGLQAYVSPPIDASGMRVKMQIPAGWSEYSKMPSPVPNGFIVLIKPPDKLPDWVTRFGRPAWVRGEPVVLSIAFQKRLPLQSPRLYSISVTSTADPFSKHTYYEADRPVASPDSKYDAIVHYIRTDKATFDRTVKTVLDSVHIER